MYLHDEAPSKASGPRRRIRSQGGHGYSEGTINSTVTTLGRSNRQERIGEAKALSVVQNHHNLKYMCRGGEIDRRIENAASQEMELLMANGQLAADSQQTFEQNKMPLHIIPLQ